MHRVFLLQNLTFLKIKVISKVSNDFLLPCMPVAIFIKHLVNVIMFEIKLHMSTRFCKIDYLAETVFLNIYSDLMGLLKA